jgi:hypothetical protein
MHQHDLSTRHGSTPPLTGCDFLQVSSLATIGNRAIALLDNKLIVPAVMYLDHAGRVAQDRVDEKEFVIGQIH